MKTLLACIALIGIGWLFGWHAAHIHIGLECERLGKFFVKKRVYHCDQWHDIDDDEQKADEQ